MIGGDQEAVSLARKYVSPPFPESHAQKITAILRVREACRAKTGNKHGFLREPSGAFAYGLGARNLPSARETGGRSLIGRCASEGLCSERRDHCNFSPRGDGHNVSVKTAEMVCAHIPFSSKREIDLASSK